MVHSAFAQTIPQVDPSLPSASSFKVITPDLSPLGNGTNRATIPSYYRPDYQKQIAQYEQDQLRVELEKQQALQKSERFIEDFKTVHYDFPTSSNDARVVHYYDAFDALLSMNPDNYALKEATFIVENAFYENTKSSADFEAIIQNTTDYIKQSINENQLNAQEDLVKNQMIYRYMTDTLNTGGQTHYPFEYDFNDYMGQQNWDNMFVHKLINEGSGQCNSMPRYYLILAEELDAEAYLAFAPNHSFIRFRDDIGEWRNVELTSGAVMSDIFMMDSGFIKSETLLSNNYLTAQTKRQVMAQLLNDLASGYVSKFGYNQFVKRIVDASLELNPEGINGHLHKINYQIQQMGYVFHQLGLNSPNQLQGNPQGEILLQELIVQDNKLKNLGYETMPRERYEAWLASLEEERQRQGEQDLLIGLRENTIKN